MSHRDEGPLQPYVDSEIVFGLVAPVGTDLGLFSANLEKALEQYRYAVFDVRVSALAQRFAPHPPPDGEEREVARLERQMDAGNGVREKADYALALAVASMISAKRASALGSDPKFRIAYVVRSLKHPEEVFALRRIYGDGFFLLGVVTSENERCDYLQRRKGCSTNEIADLRARDDYEGKKHGQRTRDAFHLADVFLPLNDTSELHRFLDLIFSAPHVTPSVDEHSMFLAFSAALRSGDLSRQVGAAILSANGDVIATGANDVPQTGGGLCWPGRRDKRDFILGKDFNEVERAEIIDDVLQRLRPESLDSEVWQAQGRKALIGSAIMDITEYGRPVHAEMDAVLAAGRIGVSVRGGTPYCTTFPCHGCAKHLIASGLSRIVYVEPYPKSRTPHLYGDFVKFSAEDPRDLVLFEPFKGVGPRRFFDLFSMNLGSGNPIKRKEKGGIARRDWTPARGEARVPLLPNTYRDRENWASEEIDRLFSNVDGELDNG